MINMNHERIVELKDCYESAKSYVDEMRGKIDILQGYFKERPNTSWIARKMEKDFKRHLLYFKTVECILDDRLTLNKERKMK